MNITKTLLFLAVAIVVVAAAPGTSRGKRSPQLPPGMPAPPPGMPMPPGMLTPEMAQTLTRIARQAPPPPEGPPKRVARNAIDSEVEKPKHVRQETLYSSVTTMSRKKRGSSSNGDA